MRIAYFCIECASSDPMAAVWSGSMGTLYRCGPCGAERVVSVGPRQDIKETKPYTYAGRPVTKNPSSAIIKRSDSVILSEYDRKLLRELKVVWEEGNDSTHPH